jgi:hypothetical protein
MAVSTTKSVKEVKKELIKGDYPEKFFGKEYITVYIVPEGANDRVIEGCLNGHNWRVPVDTEVTIPVTVYETIKQSRRILKEALASQKEFEEGKVNLT